MSFNTLLTDAQLYSAHSTITYILIPFWVLVCILGYFLNNSNYKRTISIFLIAFSVIQEIFDYINRIYINDLYSVDLQKDLPLQLCHIAYWLSVLCLITLLSNKESKYQQTYFNCAYFFGFSGAFQGILTVDLTDIYTLNDMITLHLQHSLIILNVLWIIFAYNLKFTKQSIIQVFLIINVMVIPIGMINYFLNANYMFLCSPPNVDNPLLIGGWPYYIIVLELLFFIYAYILYIPYKLLEYRKKYLHSI